MSETATQLFDASSRHRQGGGDGDSTGLKNIGADTKSELARLGSHGATEAGAALFQGNGFVLYSPRPKPPKLEAGSFSRADCTRGGSTERSKLARSGAGTHPRQRRIGKKRIYAGENRDTTVFESGRFFAT